MELNVINFNDIVKRLLLSQYKRENFLDVFVIIETLMKDIQTGNFQLRDMMWLEDATGEQLNLIGRLWNVQRYGKQDEDFRKAIYTKIQESASGTVNEMLSNLIGVYGGTYARYYPVHPACFFIESDATISQSELEALSPSGVGVMLYDPQQLDELSVLKYNHTLEGGDRKWICDSSFKFLSLTGSVPDYVSLNKDVQVVVSYTKNKLITYAVD